MQHRRSRTHASNCGILCAPRIAPDRVSDNYTQSAHRTVSPRCLSTMPWRLLFPGKPSTQQNHLEKSELIMQKNFIWLSSGRTGPAVQYVCTEPGTARYQNYPVREGYYSLEGATAPMPCPVGTWRNETRGDSLAACAACPAQRYCPRTAMLQPLFCWDPAGLTGVHCPPGSVNITVCEGGWYCPLTSISRVICPAGWRCPAGSLRPIRCEHGQFCAEGSESANECPPGYVGNSLNGTYASFDTACRACPPGKHDAGGSSCAPCPRGRVCPEYATALGHFGTY